MGLSKTSGVAIMLHHLEYRQEPTRTTAYSSGASAREWRVGRGQVRSVAKGREELLGLLSRRKYGERFERYAPPPTHPGPRVRGITGNNCEGCLILQTSPSTPMRKLPPKLRFLCTTMLLPHQMGTCGRCREVAGRRLQRSQLDMRFHIRDLIGLGDVQRVATTAGPLLRLVKR